MQFVRLVTETKEAKEIRNNPYGKCGIYMTCADWIKLLLEIYKTQIEDEDLEQFGMNPNEKFPVRFLSD